MDHFIGILAVLLAKHASCSPVEKLERLVQRCSVNWKCPFAGIAMGRGGGFFNGITRSSTSLFPRNDAHILGRLFVRVCSIWILDLLLSYDRQWQMGTVGVILISVVLAYTSEGGFVEGVHGNGYTSWRRMLFLERAGSSHLLPWQNKSTIYLDYCYS